MTSAFLPVTGASWNKLKKFTHEDINKNKYNNNKRPNFIHTLLAPTTKLCATLEINPSTCTPRSLYREERGGEKEPKIKKRQHARPRLPKAPMFCQLTINRLKHFL